MDLSNGGGEIDRLEQGLLAGDSQPADVAGYIGGSFDEEDPVLYAASFEEAEDNFVRYQTAKWVLYSMLLILAWGIGVFMLLYLPIRRHIWLKDFGSRKLFVTSNAIVYKVIKPVAFPCFGFLKKEKHVVLPSVAGIVIEQGYLQSKFGVYSVRIESIGVRRPASDDVKIQGIANPLAFRKAVLMHLSNMRSQAFSRQASVLEDSPILAHSSAASISPLKLRSQASFHSPERAILQKLDEVGSSVKRVKALIEDQHPHTPELRD